MSNAQQAKYYPPSEERINVATHAAGLLLSVVGLCLLVIRALGHGDALLLAGFSVFGLSLIVLYAASTVYHSAREPGLRVKLRTVDHASIFVLIAGTYTPVALVTLGGPVGWSLFGIVWGMAIAGIVLKLFFTGRFRFVSILIYVCMGWIIVFFIGPLVRSIPQAGLAWLLAGGIAYTAGAIVYGAHKISFGHAIFHFLVLIGSICHFIAVYHYVLPAG